MKSFPAGGVHPPQNKLTAGHGIEKLPIPSSVVIPVSQHIGAPAEIIVQKGDFVKTGQLIAQSKGFVSTNIHSSVSGKISKIDTVTDPQGFKQPAVYIDVEGDEWLPSINRDTSIDSNVTLTADEIINRCQESGLVGMGGASFPIHVKLKVPEGKKCDVLLINGAECEPYLTNDHRMMLEYGEEIIIGVSIMMKALKVDKAMIGIESNKPDAIEHLKKISSRFLGISVHALKVKYPQGAEKQLIKSLINREVPLGRLPIDVNAVVQNISTAYAVYEAVQKNKPLFERVVTVTGKSVKNPGNYMVRIGTSIQNLIDAAGGLPEDTGKIVVGGPMMGKALKNLSAPIVKGTSGIVLFQEIESKRVEEGPCIRCGKCVTVCALKFEPYLMARLVEKGLYERAEEEGVANCCECASCHYICPAGRPLLDYLRLGKQTVLRMARERAAKKQAI